MKLSLNFFVFISLNEKIFMKKIYLIMLSMHISLLSSAKPYGEHLLQLLSPHTLAQVIVELQTKSLSLTSQQQSSLLPIFLKMITDIRREELPYYSVLTQQHTAIDSIKDLHLPMAQQQSLLKGVRESYKLQLLEYYKIVMQIQDNSDDQIKAVLTPVQTALWESQHQEKFWYISLLQG